MLALPVVMFVRAYPLNWFNLRLLLTYKNVQNGGIRETDMTIIILQLLPGKFAFKSLTLSQLSSSDLDRMTFAFIELLNKGNHAITTLITVDYY